MPTVFIKDGFRFFFYSNDHTPIHVHVRKGKSEAVFNVENGIELREAVGMKAQELREQRTWQERIGSLLFVSGMSILVDKPVAARHRDGKIHVTMESGLELAFPVAGNPRLEGKSHEQLNRIDISPFGLHWPDLDEDLSLKGILAGDYGRRKSQAA